mmetsp:Transcript_11546/g.25307  ORF Transcript_11546/g.25307 Transcript_11546/m.25307 type:complete len:155 (-) Transcript_11546:466-930(-)
MLFCQAVDGDEDFGFVQLGSIEGATLLSPGTEGAGKAYPKEYHPSKNVSFADVVRKKSMPPATIKKRNTLDSWKLYLDSCATYHSAFVDWCLDNVRTVDRVLKGNCNAGVTTSSEKGYFGMWDMWLNRGGITNLLSIPKLEEDGYLVDYNTRRD